MPATESLDALGIPVSKGTELDEDTNDLRSEFGDGATQRAGYGINSTKQKWTVVYTMLPNASVAILLAFLRARRKVEAFLWTPPDGTDTQRQFTISSPIKVTPEQGGLAKSVSFSVVEEHDI